MYCYVSAAVSRSPEYSSKPPHSQMFFSIMQHQALVCIGRCVRVQPTTELGYQSDNNYFRAMPL